MQMNFTTQILPCLKLAVCISYDSYVVTGILLIPIEVKCILLSIWAQDISKAHCSHFLN